MASEKKFVSLALGAQSVTGAVFSRARGGSLVLEQYASSALLADPAADSTQIDQLKAAVKDLTKKLRLKGSHVRFAVSSQSVFTRFVKLPPLEVDKLDQIVGFEAQQQVPFPLEEAVWDYQTLGDPDDIEVEVVLVALKATELDQINAAVRSQGLDTLAVDLAPMSLYNAFRFNYPDVDQPVVLIDIGAKTTNLIYVEGPKVFVRNINVGGRDITQAIAKEFDISFQEAEARKIQDGFVALGGGFADHENPEIAAMSKVIRQASTRLHSEIVRTNNFYRSNQGGSPPSLAFLCGSGAGLPYLNEFFQEKLKIPVEYFNSLRNVQTGRKIDDSVSGNAHTLGELVGLGLRGLGDCPIEIDLVPPVIKRERDLEKRKPFFWMAGLSVAVMVGAMGLFYMKASDYAAQEIDVVRSKVSTLEGFAEKIAAEQDRLKSIESRSLPYSQAVQDRVYWITTFKELNEKMASDLIWFVEVQPLSEGKQLLEQAGLDQSGAIVGTEVVEQGKEYVIDKIQLKGLWREDREDNPQGSKVVFEYLDMLRNSDVYPRFELVERDPDANNAPVLDADGNRKKLQPDLEILPYVDHGTSGDKHAYQFTMELPLPPGRQRKFTK